MKINIVLDSPQAIPPSYSTEGAGAFDFTTLEGWTRIPPNSSRIFDTGIKMKIPEGFTLLLFSRSGHGFSRGIRLANCVGVIDSDYTGRIKFSLHNDSDEHQEIFFGDRIGQGIIVQTPQVSFDVVDELPETKRGEGGFGSTGR